MYRSTKERAQAVRELFRQWYEPGRQDRCKRWVWRTKILPEFGISLRTFCRYLGFSEDEVRAEYDPAHDPRQMSLFPDF